MAVVINELEIVLEPPPPKQQPTGGKPAPEKPTFGPQELLIVMDREQRNDLRLLAH
jgi:hypothetical protein